MNIYILLLFSYMEPILEKLIELRHVYHSLQYMKARNSFRGNDEAQMWENQYDKIIS